jgi:hypothetical protein
MRFASQQRLQEIMDDRPDRINGKFSISSGGLRDRVTFAEIGNRLALHPQKHKGHRTWASCGG